MFFGIYYFAAVFAARGSKLAALEQNVIEAPHRYVVQGSDTTMLLIAASLFGQ